MPRTPATNREKLKTERMSVVTTPDKREKINKIAFMQRKTINELFNDMITAYISHHKSDLQKYDQTFNTGTEDQEE